MNTKIVCLKVGNKYSSIYVNNLFYMIQKNTTKSHFDFFCFTEDRQGIDKNINVIKLPEINDHRIYGWFYKLALFDKKINPLNGRILYLDLDIIIVSNIDSMIEYECDKMTIIEDWIYKKHNVKKYNSSVMLWNIDQYQNLFFDFKNQTKSKKYTGDQDFISEYIKDVNFWPENWCISYKWHECERKQLPDETKIIVFHGRPKPTELNKNDPLLKYTIF